MAAIARHSSITAKISTTRKYCTSPNCTDRRLGQIQHEKACRGAQALLKRTMTMKRRLSRRNPIKPTNEMMLRKTPRTMTPAQQRRTKANAAYRLGTHNLHIGGWAAGIPTATVVDDRPTTCARTPWAPMAMRIMPESCRRGDERRRVGR